jgi:putative transcriptional regulator
MEARERRNKAGAIRFSTLDALCRELDCQSGDLLIPGEFEAPDTAGLEEIGS